MTSKGSRPESDSTVMDRVSSEFAKTVSGELKAVAEGIQLLPGFGNCTLIVADEGAVVVDPGLFQNGPRVVNALRSLTDLPVRYVVYTHGHYDHAFGTPAILEDAAKRGHAPPAIVGHANVARRFARYRKTAGHLAETYTLQFASWTKGGVLGGGTGGEVVHQAIYVPPTLEYEDRIVLRIGDLTLHCRHGLGETDDHTWLWIPERKVIIGGVFRGERALEMLKVTSEALRCLEDEVVRRLNEGQWYEEILHAVELPDALAASPFLQPVYGCTAFAVHSILRRYTGWYDGNPSHLFPSRGAEIAGEVLALAGGAAALLQRARSLVAKGERGAIQRALHLLDFVIEGAGSESAEVAEARNLKAETLEARAEHEDSFIARNILASAAVLEKRRGRSC